MQNICRSTWVYPYNLLNIKLDCNEKQKKKKKKRVSATHVIYFSKNVKGHLQSTFFLMWSIIHGFLSCSYI